jgi:hypothetical protein
MSLGLPSISISFQNTAATTIAQGTRGIVALILTDSVHSGANTYTSIADIQTNLSAYNQKQITLAFIGGLNADGTVAAPIKVIAYIVTATDYTAAMTYFESIKWNYLTVPGVTSENAATISTWVKGLRDTHHKRVKAVLPNVVGDHEGIINFDTDNIVVDVTTYDVGDYCSRIAGILAGIPLTIASTYQTLDEIDSIPTQTDTQLNAAIAAGELVLFTDVDIIRIARGVNSLTTLTTAKGTDFQKIKIVDIMDQIYDDITLTANNTYIGKVPNDYDHKCLLISAINTYLEQLSSASILDKSATNSVGIDIVAQTAWLTAQGVDVTALTAQQIKEYNTGSNVFLGGTVTPVDAMEDITLAFTLGV